MTYGPLANANYYLLNAPGVADQFQPYQTHMLWGIVILLSLLIGVGISALEGARHTTEAIRLPLLAEVTTLEAIAKVQSAEDEAVKLLEQETHIASGQLDGLEQLINQLRFEMGAYPDSDLVSLARTLRQSALAYDDFRGKLRDIIGEAWSQMDPLVAVRELMALAQSHEEATKRAVAANTRAAQAEMKLNGLMTQLNERWEAQREIAARESLSDGVAAAEVHLCDVCHINGLTSTEKGIAGRTKWQRHFGRGNYACRECRAKAGI